MDTVSSTVPDSPQSHQRRALWPWVVSAIVLMLTAVGLSFWWPMHRAERFIRLLAENNCTYRAKYNHPPWTKYFLGENTYHPWFDAIEQINANGMEADDSVLRDFFSHSDLKELYLNVKSGSEKSLIHVSQLNQLEHLTISVHDSKIPSQSFAGLSKLSYVQLRGVVVDTSLWMVLTQELNLPWLSLYECRYEGEFSLAGSCNLEKILFRGREVDPSFAKAIANVDSLQSLEFLERSFAVKFRREPMSNQKIARCGIRAPIRASDWEFLVQINNLESLSIGVYKSFSTEIKIENLSSVVKLKDLKELELLGDSFRIESSYEFLGQLSKLEKLELDDTPPTTELLRGITLIPRLTDLRLDYSKAESADWLILTHCKSLKKLIYTKDCSFRDAAEEFKAARPDVEVTQR